MAEAAEIEREVILSYVPRPHFEALHASTKRWIFVVAHRRAGKTVALVNHLIKAALLNPKKNASSTLCIHRSKL